MQWYKKRPVNVVKSQRQHPLWVSKISRRLSLPCNEMVIEDLCFSLWGEKVTMQGCIQGGQLLLWLCEVHTSFTHCWRSRSPLVVCFDPLAMVAGNPQCGFLSCHSGGTMEGFFFCFGGAGDGGDGGENGWAAYVSESEISVCVCVCLYVCGSERYGWACTGMWTVSLGQ